MNEHLHLRPGVLPVDVARRQVEEVGAGGVGDGVRQGGLARLGAAIKQDGLGVGGDVGVHVLRGADGQDAELGARLPHLSHGGVRHDASLLQRGAQVVEVAHVVVDPAVRNRLNHLVGHELGVQALQRAVRSGVLLALLALLVLALFALALLALALFALPLLTLLAALSRPLCRHHVLEVLQQHAHLLVHLHADLLKHHGLQRLLDEVGVELLKEVGALVDVLPVALVVAHRAVDQLDEVVRTLGLLPVARRALGGGALLLLATLGSGRTRGLVHLRRGRRRIQDLFRPAILGVGEVGVLARGWVAVLHEPLVDAVLDELAHVLPLGLLHLLLQRHQRLVVLRDVLRLHRLAPLQVAQLAQHGVHGVVARRRLHPDEHQLRLGDGVDAAPRQEPAHQRLHTRRRLLGRHGAAHERHLLLQRLRLLERAHEARALAPLPPPLVHLQHADGLLLPQVGRHVQLLLPRHAHVVLLHQRFQELGAALQLGPAILHKVLGDGQLQHVRGQLQVHQDVVEVDAVDSFVEPHQPALDLQYAPQHRLHRLLHVHPLLRVRHLVVRLLELAEDLHVLDVYAAVLADLHGCQRRLVRVLRLQLVQQLHHALAPLDVERNVSHGGRLRALLLLSRRRLRFPLSHQFTHGCV
mmetsp:Transcript_27563/g.67782  ORF Transcript_27563/g.67782 Transcript_27563/m.67782 type:complete len:640 (+) Transcript_27563:2062-3981(+)